MRKKRVAVTGERAERVVFKVRNKHSGWVLGTFDTMEEVHHRIGKKYCRRVWEIRAVRR